MKKAKRKAGRPKSVNPLSRMIRFRVTEEVAIAVEAYRKKHNLLDQSEAARKAILVGLQADGVLQ